MVDLVSACVGFVCFAVIGPRIQLCALCCAFLGGSPVSHLHITVWWLLVDAQMPVSLREKTCALLASAADLLGLGHALHQLGAAFTGAWKLSFGTWPSTDKTHVPLALKK